MGLPVAPRYEQPKGRAFAFKKDHRRREGDDRPESGPSRSNRRGASPFGRRRASSWARLSDAAGPSARDRAYYCERLVLDTPFQSRSARSSGDESAPTRTPGQALPRRRAPDWPRSSSARTRRCTRTKTGAECLGALPAPRRTSRTARASASPALERREGRQKLEVATRASTRGLHELSHAWVAAHDRAQQLEPQHGPCGTFILRDPELGWKKIPSSTRSSRSPARRRRASGLTGGSPPAVSIANARFGDELPRPHPRP